VPIIKAPVEGWKFKAHRKFIKDQLKKRFEKVALKKNATTSY
jgi:hypothetical protein